MTIKPLAAGDWEHFHALAAAEGWKISFQEQRLFQSLWRPHFHALWHQGRCCGFVSAVLYKTSGWIGNLLIDPELGRRGYGSRLFEHAMEEIESDERVERVWLTASEQGAPLYRKHGFVEIDRVERWSATGLGERFSVAVPDLTRLLELDKACWGEDRSTLLRLLAQDGCTFAAGKMIAQLQVGVNFCQLGPWLAEESTSATCRTLLDQALHAVPADRPLVCDVLASAELALVLQKAGFVRGGENLLMCSSSEPPLLNGVIALASLGSIG